MATLHTGSMSSAAARQSALVVEDLIQGLNEWRNIQDIVRLTFKAFHDVLKAQGEAIKSLERQVENKANKQEVAATLQQKAGISEFNAKLVEINALIASKADAAEASIQLEKRVTKQDLQQALKAAVGETKNALDNKADLAEFAALRMESQAAKMEHESSFDNFRAETEASLENIRTDIKRKAGTEELVARLEAKAGIMEVNQALELKADIADVDDKLNQSKTAFTEKLQLMNKKANKADTDSALASLREELGEVTKHMDHTMHGLTNNVGEKVDRHDLEEMRGLVFRELATTHEEIRTTSSRLDVNADTTAAALRTLSTRCDTSFAELRSQVDNCNSNQEKAHAATERVGAQQQAAAEKLHTLQSTVTVFQEKITGVNDRVGRVEQRLGTESHDRKTAIDEVRDSIREMGSKRASLSDAQEAAMSAAQRSAEDRMNERCTDILRTLELKADIVQVNDALSHKANIAAVNSALERLEASQAMTVTGDQLSKKADLNDVCALIDLKSNITDVNSALSDLQVNIDTRAPLEELRRVVHDQAIINASLCADCSLGRWIWKSGKTKHGNCVPWNVQSVNTDSDNFLWEKDKVTVTTVAPGLYEVTFGFFTHRKPSVQLLVNGEPVLAAVNSSSYVVHHSSGRLTSIGRHPAGNVTGLTLIDFLALPPRARIALTYNGEEAGEGFLSLKKL